MEELLDEVERTMKNELARANKKNPLFNSLHQAYGVLAEEIDEARESFKYTEEAFDKFFMCMRKDHYRSAREYLEDIRAGAIDCAAEAVQVAAMAQKAIDSINAILKCDMSRGKHDEQKTKRL